MEATVIDSSKAYSLVPYDRLLIKMAALGMDSRVVVGKGIPVRSFAQS